MLDFKHYLPTRLLFGRNKISLIGTIAKELGYRALIVTGKNSTKKTGLLYRVIDLLEKESITYAVFDQVEPNPLTTTIEKGVAVAKEINCDMIIGLGGGSSLDAAKAIAFSVINPGHIREYIFGKPGNNALPIIAVTTTAGTGSEGDSLSVLTDPKTNDKKSLKSPYIYPKVSIIDSTLMTTLPPHIIAATGFDALCHAIEAYIAQRSNPLSDMMALKAIKMLSQQLTKVYENPNDLDAWDEVAFANTLGGMVIDSAGVTLPHGLEHPISGLLNVVHGEGLAALIVPLMEYTYPVLPHKFKNIAIAMGENIEELTIEEAAAKSVFAVQKLLCHLNLTPTLTDLGVSPNQIDWCATNAMKTMKYAIENNPNVPTIEEIKKLYEKCL